MAKSYILLYDSDSHLFMFYKIVKIMIFLTRTALLGNGEVSPIGYPGMKCVDGDPGFPNGTMIGAPRPSLINSYVWLYEW